MDITQDQLKELLTYNQETGCFVWLTSRGCIKKGSLAGCLYGSGYNGIGINGKIYLTHRLAFLYMTGEFPAFEIDHINGIKTDNRWINIREATRSQNLHNIGLKSSNTSGFKGVSFIKRQNKWRAKITSCGKVYWLGVFGTPQEAAEAYNAEAIRLHGEFAKF